MSNELPPTSAWIYTQLAAPIIAAGLVDSGGYPRIYEEINTTGAEAYPFIVIILQSPGGTLLTLNGNKVWTDPLFQVAAVDRAENWDALQGPADIIDAQLHQARGTVPPIRIVECVRERPHWQVFTEDGTEYRKLGSMFRIKVAEA